MENSQQKDSTPTGPAKPVMENSRREDPTPTDPTKPVMESPQREDPAPTDPTKPVMESPQREDPTPTDPTKPVMESPQREDPTPTGPTKPVPEKRTSRRALPFAIGIVAGLALAIAWPKLAPLATCLQEVAQNEFPIKPGTEGDEWRKFYLATMIGAVGVLIGSLMSRRLLTFVLGLIAGLGLAMVWPKLAPLATCLQELAQNEFPIKTGPV
jgi:uncharacterized membrane protein